MKCWFCDKQLRIKPKWKFAECIYCNNINRLQNKSQKLPINQDLLNQDYNIQQNNEENTNINNNIHSHLTNYQKNKDNYTYPEFIEDTLRNGYYNFNNYYYQPQPFLDRKKRHLGPYYPYLPPPEYEWHEQMDEYIKRMNKINKITKLLRSEYNQRSSVLDEYAKPRVYAMKTLFDTVEDINLRRELTYRDLVRGEFNFHDFTYKDLIDKKQITDLKQLRGDYFSENYNSNTKYIKESSLKYNKYNDDTIRYLSNSVKLPTTRFGGEYTDFKIRNDFIPSNSYLEDVRKEKLKIMDNLVNKENNRYNENDNEYNYDKMNTNINNKIKIDLSNKNTLKPIKHINKIETRKLNKNIGESNLFKNVNINNGKKDYSYIDKLKELTNDKSYVNPLSTSLPIIKRINNSLNVNWS